MFTLHKDIRAYLVTSQRKIRSAEIIPILVIKNEDTVLRCSPERRHPLLKKVNELMIARNLPTELVVPDLTVLRISSSHPERLDVFDGRSMGLANLVEELVWAFDRWILRAALAGVITSELGWVGLLQAAESGNEEVILELYESIGVFQLFFSVLLHGDGGGIIDAGPIESILVEAM